MKHTDIIKSLSLEQKCALLSGGTVFTTRALPGKGIPAITLSLSLIHISMYNHTDVEEDKTKTYLEPDSVELEILQYLNDSFDDVVLLLNSSAAVDLSWVEAVSYTHLDVYKRQTSWWAS